MNTRIIHWRKLSAGRYHSCGSWSRWHFDPREDWLVEKEGRSWKVTPPPDLDLMQFLAWEELELAECDFLWTPQNDPAFKTLRKAQAVAERFVKRIFCDCGTELVRDEFSAEYGDYCPNENCSVVRAAI